MMIGVIFALEVGWIALLVYLLIKFALPHALVAPEAQAIFWRCRHHARKPPLANIRSGSPAPAMGPGTPGTGAIDADSTFKISKAQLHVCARARASWGLIFEMSAHKHGVCFDDDRYTLPKNWTRMSEVTCRERHWCRQMLERGLSLVIGRATASP